MKLPVKSLIQPIMNGPTKPPRLPIELIVAIPAAAAEPDRNMVGMVQSGGFADEMPMLTIVSASTTKTTPVALPEGETGRRQQAGADDVPRPFAGPVRMTSPHHHGEDRHGRQDHVQQANRHRRNA